MKIIQTKNTSKKILLAGLLTLAVIGASACVYVYAYNGTIFGWSKNKPNSDSSINYEAPTQEQKDEGLSAKEAFVDKYYSDADKKDTDANANTDSTPSKDIPTIISSTSQTSDTVQIRTIIQSVNPGVCSLTMALPGGISITREADTQNLGSYSTCKGFDIPLSDLQNGTWDITVSYKNDSEAGTANQKMEIKK